MALCCIGGVCIPYSALIPIVVLGLQWILQKLAAAGLLPASWSNAFQQYTASTQQAANKPTIRRGKQCKSVSCCAPVVECKTEDDWNTLWCSSTATVLLVKFTAPWCKPCKAIQPHFEALERSAVKIQLVTVDADELDEVASEYGVMQLPTFVAIDTSTQKAVGSSYSGSDPGKLQEWWETTQKKIE